MNPCTIVTLTGYPDIFAQFHRSVERFEPRTRKAVVTSRGLHLNLPGWDVLSGIEPFNFARNANLGIQAAAPGDVLLINDDVQFLTPGTVLHLQRIAYLHPEVGILSPQFEGQVGNRLQSRRVKRLGRLTYSSERLCFTAVYLKRSVLDRIGLLDERYHGYGSEDDDYCLRVQDVGLKLAVTPEVVMRHGFGKENASASFRRAIPSVEASAKDNYRLFCEKRGFVIP